MKNNTYALVRDLINSPEIKSHKHLKGNTALNLLKNIIRKAHYECQLGPIS
jgi:hypothetical protein